MKLVGLSPLDLDRRTLVLDCGEKEPYQFGSVAFGASTTVAAVVSFVG